MRHTTGEKQIFLVQAKSYKMTSGSSSVAIVIWKSFGGWMKPFGWFTNQVVKVYVGFLESEARG